MGCADGHHSNQAAETHLSGNRLGWPAHLFQCEEHILATILKETLFYIMRDVLRGTLRSALSVAHGEEMQLFRECLFQEVYLTLEVKSGASSPLATRYREECIRTFFGTHGKLARVIASNLPNGDWLRDDAVEYYALPSSTRLHVQSVLFSPTS